MRLCLLTVCGGGLEYEFLLGSIREHAEISDEYFVYDVSSPAERKVFRNLPRNTVWIAAAKEYCSGNWKTFRSRTAIMDLYELVRKNTSCDVLIRLDCDEFVTPAVFDAVSRVGRTKGMEHYIAHYSADLSCYFKPGGYARRICGVDVPFDLPENKAWQRCKDYDGNPERHAIPIWRAPVIRVESIFHYHVHYAFPQKGYVSKFDWEPCQAPPLPGLLQRWKTNGRLPSEEFL